MRIISGHKRGLKLTPLGSGDETARLRPTTDRVRESLFNILQNGTYGDVVTGARVLDLFAGTGALGLEAFSRGAEFVQFVENGKTSLHILQKNIAMFDAPELLHVQKNDARFVRQNRAEPFTLLFLDPPYGTELGKQALHNAAQRGFIAKGALVAFENNNPLTALDHFEQIDERHFGKTVFSFLVFK